MQLTPDILDKTKIPYAVPFEELNEAFRVSKELIETLPPEAVKEMMGGYEKDLDLLLQSIVTETYQCMYGGLHAAKSQVGKFNPSSVHYLDKLTKSVEELLVQESLTYFLMSIMPDFEMNWHHVEWAESAQQYKYLCMLAARDHGKCHGKGTKVRMFDGSIKNIEEIKKGDLVMGVDSTPREVISTHSGVDNLYMIKQSKGDDYVVNSKHTLTLIHKNRLSKREEVVDIDLPELQKFSTNWIKERFRGFKVPIELPEKDLPIEPYYLGLWLGDGNKNNTVITTADEEIVNYLKSYADRIEHKCTKVKSSKYSWRIHNKGGDNKGIFSNKVLISLSEQKLLFNKHIPEIYLRNSRKNRLKLLAGLIDSDGDKWCGSFHFNNTNKILAEQVKDLADSLGFKAKILMSKDDYENYCVSISGNLYEIPTLLKRKSVTREYKETNNSNKIPNHIDGIPISRISSLQIESIGVGEYFGITIDGDSRYVLADGTVTHNSYFWSNGYAAWRLYRYKKTSKRLDLNKLGREGWLFSFSKTQGSRLLTTLKESIEEIPMLRERLYPGTTDGWAETKIKCKNGTKVIVGSAGESVRGAHPGWIVVDDFLKDNVLYSEEQRKKSIDYFHSVVMNMIQPGGQVVVVGTPFHAQDLYGDLKTKKGWHVREYPSIFPDGTILWSNRYDFKTLYEKKETQGSINFSREHLCRPITSDSSIFPFSILERSLVGSQIYTMVKNIESFPVKLERVGIGVDLAISSNIGADHTVMVVGGIDAEENIWILDLVRLHGASYDQQIAQLKTLNFNFRPNVIQIETNGFQAMFGQMAERENLPVINAATTAKSKNDLKTGLPGVALLFERGKIKIPHGDQRSRDMKDLIFTEFSSITWTSNGLQATGSHDDIPMAIHQLVKGLDYRNTGFGFAWT